MRMCTIAKMAIYYRWRGSRQIATAIAIGDFGERLGKHCIIYIYVIGLEKTCHVDKKNFILFMITIQHLLIYRMHLILFYLNVQK